MSLTIAPPRFPEPPPKFDRDNEAQFRRALERALTEIINAAGSGSGGGGGGGAPTDAEYVVLSLDGTLTDERTLAAGAGLSIADAGAGGNVSLALARTRDDTLSFTTASLANLATEDGTIDIGGSAGILMKLTADRACWVRLYTTSAARSADSSRAITTDPTPGTGVLGDFYFTAGSTIPCSPPPVLTNLDGTPGDTIYYAVKNLSGATSTVQVDLTVILLEE